MHSRNPDVVHLADLISRTPASVAIRLTNFANVDPFHQSRGVTGMSGGRAQVEPIWVEFLNDKEQLLFESERELAKLESITLEEKFPKIFEGINNYRGEKRFIEVKGRINQNIFRKIVLVNYQSRCAISGIDIPDLLIASHIIPWSINPDERLNPENGICLSALYDKAFDKGLITINENYKVVLSPLLFENEAKSYFRNTFFEASGFRILEPQKYLPSQEALEYHRLNIFKK